MAAISEVQGSSLKYLPLILVFLLIWGGVKISGLLFIYWLFWNSQALSHIPSELS